MNENKPVIVDSNILISILLKKESAFLENLRSAKYQLYICESTIIELFKHKDRIIEYSELSEDKITKVYHFLLKRVNIFKEDLIEKSNWEHGKERTKKK